MKTTVSKKAPAETTREGFQSKLNLTLDGKFKRFDVSNNTESLEKIQCPKCNPPFVKPRGAVKFCADCQADGEFIEKVLLKNLSKPRRVIKLHRCIACEQNFALSKFSIYFGICRNCFADRKSPKVARRLAAQAVRNVGRIFGGVR